MGAATTTAPGAHPPDGLQHAAMRAAQPLLRQAAQLLLPPGVGAPQPPQQQLVVRALDCGSGHTEHSLEALDEVLQALPCSSSRPLEVEATFQGPPELIDFNTLVAAASRTSSLTPAASPESSSSRAPRSISVYARCTARSCFERLAPARSLRLITAFSGLHLLPERPCTPPDTAISGMSAHAPTRAAFEAAWTRAFHSFLTLRATEAVPGAAMVVALPSLHEPVDSDPLTLVNLAVKAMHAEGVLTSAHLAAMATPGWVPALQQVTAVLGGQEEWEVLDAHEQTIADPAWTAYQAGQLSRAQAAQHYRVLWEAVLQPFWLHELQRQLGPSRGQQVVDELFGRAAAAFEAAPVPILQNFVFLLLRRR